MVAPVLLYGCEVWGSENKDIFQSFCLQFYKMILGLKKKYTLVKYSRNFILFITYNSFPNSYNSAFDNNINRKSTQFTIYYTVRCTFFKPSIQRLCDQYKQTGYEIIFNTAKCLNYRIF
jgi:hypothetical protein